LRWLNQKQTKLRNKTKHTMKPTRYTLPTITKLRTRNHSDKTADIFTIAAMLLAVVFSVAVYLLER